jgi:hypothetical protein
VAEKTLKDFNHFIFSPTSVTITSASPKNINNIKLSAILKNLSFNDRPTPTHSSSKHMFANSNSGINSSIYQNNTCSASKLEDVNISLPLNNKSRNPIIKISRQGSKHDSMNSVDVKKKNAAISVKMPVSCKKNDGGISNYQKYIKNVKLPEILFINCVFFMNF